MGQTLRPDTHKDGVSYFPALKGETFDRGPTICDSRGCLYNDEYSEYLCRYGDWKLYRFWYDNPQDQTHRYELYNLKEDIGEERNLAAEEPEKLKELSIALDAFYEASKALGYNPNRAYNHRMAGTWYATSDTGTIAAKDGALALKSKKAGYTVGCNYFSKGAKDGFVALEAKSKTETPLRFAGPNNGKVIELGKEWKKFELPGSKSLSRI